MPYVPVLGNIAEVISFGTLAAAGSDVKNIITVYAYRLALITLPPTKTALETAFQAMYVASILPAYNSRYTQTQNTVRYVNDATDPPTVFARAVAGAIATDSLPSDVCVSMLFRTALRGRSYRGGKHFPASSEVDTTGDVLTGAGLARWQTVQAAVFANLIDGLGNVWTPSVFSRFLSTVTPNPTTIVANDVSQVLLNKNTGQMRRRKVRTVR